MVSIAKIRDKERAPSRRISLFATLSFGFLITAPVIAKPKKSSLPQHHDTTALLGPYTLSLHDGLRELTMRAQLVELGLIDKTTSSASVRPLLNSLPSVLPSSGYISSGFGMRRSPFSGRRRHHNGLDIAVAHGSAVKATAAGKVSEAGWRRNLGYSVTIDHASGIKTRYGHNSRLRVQIGDEVKRGDTIALAGSTGLSTGSHVHYEVWVKNKRIDPRTMLFGPHGDDIGSTAWASAGTSVPPLPSALGLGGDEDDTLGSSCTRQHAPAVKQRIKKSF
jgi:murein DD-endopeptidase MepM/ murein hydrolase activator NlpD